MRTLPIASLRSLPPKTPRCARPARGAAALPGPPPATSACIASRSEAPLWAPRSGWGRLPPLGWRQVHRVRLKALGRFLASCWPPMHLEAALGRAACLSLAWDGKGDRSPGAAAKLKYLAYKLKLGPEGKRRLAVFQELSNCCWKVSVSSAPANLVVPTNSGAESDAESASELRRNLRQSLA